MTYLTNNTVGTWFDDKVCHCSIFGYRKEDLTWPAESNWEIPPTCRHCGLWDSRLVFECKKCRQYFYRWFSHPKNQFHVDKGHNPVGWFCYSCLENDPPLGLLSTAICVQKRKVPPVEDIIPTGYVHAVKKELPAEIQAELDAFRARLKGISCQNPSSGQS
jgi:hypothetical protein